MKYEKLVSNPYYKNISKKMLILKIVTLFTLLKLHLSLPSRRHYMGNIFGVYSSFKSSMPLTYTTLNVLALISE